MRALAPLACAVVAWVLCVITPYRPATEDSNPGFLGAAVVACQGNQDLAHVPLVVAQVRAKGLPYWVTVTPDGHGLVSTFGPAPAWLGSTAFVGKHPGDPLDDGEMHRRTRFATGAAIGVSAAMACVAAMAWTRVWLAIAAALIAACSFAGAPILGQDLWQQTTALPPLLGALAAVAWTGRHRVATVLAPALACVALMIRPADAPLVVSLLAAWAVAAREHRRDLLPAAVVAAIAIAPFVAWNLGNVGTPWPRGQWVSNAAAGEHVFELSPTWIGEALLGLLVSPGRGLLFFAPLVLAGLAASLVRPTTLTSILALGVVSQLLLSASFFRWTGGVSFGPRLLAGAGWIAIVLSAATFDSLPRSARGATIAAAALTVLVGLLGSFAFDLRQWEFANALEKNAERVWLVRDSMWTRLFTRIEEPPPPPNSGKTVVFCPDGPKGRWAIGVR